VNPGHTVFLAPAIEEPLNVLYRFYSDTGLISIGPCALFSGSDLGPAVAEAMVEQRQSRVRSQAFAA
jgi:hypothetical protein